MTTLQSIEAFTAQKNIAVAGVSRKKQKFGNAIYKEMAKKGYNVYPVNPNLKEYDGKKCYKDIASLPEEVTAIIINTKTETTKELVAEAKGKGIKHLWLQQGAADKETLNNLPDNGTNFITKECIMMFAGEVKGIHGFHKWLKKSFGSYPK